MIKCPTHSPITASKMSNCAIMLARESALTHPPPHGHMHTHTLKHLPPHGGTHTPLHRQTHTHMHTPMQPHQRTHTHMPMQPHGTRGIVRRALPVSSTT
ncbi:hypothetical protein O181_020547 [Austropuccinia psidii MF-1]|uniref:Uncharacterized protein n=1 Tax=Austropuccinia psidii MF-1 TaxID=1389203 RepID=A0A9Q3CBV4_9BASI|nr:hypothetical protein [Austropuccinia psidii MF-1]